MMLPNQMSAIYCESRILTVIRLQQLKGNILRPDPGTKVSEFKAFGSGVGIGEVYPASPGRCWNRR